MLDRVGHLADSAVDELVRANALQHARRRHSEEGALDDVTYRLPVNDTRRYGAHARANGGGGKSKCPRACAGS